MNKTWTYSCTPYRRVQDANAPQDQRFSIHPRTVATAARRMDPERHDLQDTKCADIRSTQSIQNHLQNQIVALLTKVDVNMPKSQSDYKLIYDRCIREIPFFTP